MKEDKHWTVKLSNWSSLYMARISVAFITLHETCELYTCVLYCSLIDKLGYPKRGHNRRLFYCIALGCFIYFILLFFWYGVGVDLHCFALLSKHKLDQQLNSTEFEVRLHSYRDTVELSINQLTNKSINQLIN